MRRNISAAILLKLSLLLMLLFMVNEMMAQRSIEKKTIPPFRILLTNMKYYKAADMEKNKTAMILYFDPTCEHCKAFITDLLLHESDFAQTQITMISYAPIDQIKKFAADFNISKYSNIKIGTEGYTFIVQRYFNISKFPFVALFDKRGLMISSYHIVPLISQLINDLYTHN